MAAQIALFISPLVFLVGGAVSSSNLADSSRFSSEENRGARLAYLCGKGRHMLTNRHY